jgi:hypothetical protein
LSALSSSSGAATGLLLPSTVEQITISSEKTGTAVKE